MQFPPTEGPVILGQTEEQKVGKLVEKLGTHLRMAHPQEFGNVLRMAGEITGFMICCQFDSADNLEFTERRTKSAAALNGLVRRVLTDEEIEKQVAKLPFPEYRGHPGIHGYRVEDISSLVRQMRDFLYYVDVLQPQAVKA